MMYYWSSNKFLQGNKNPSCLNIKLRLFVSLITQFSDQAFISSAITRSAKSSVAKATSDSENLDYCRSFGSKAHKKSYSKR